jgi:hypothetical protein
MTDSYLFDIPTKQVTIWDSWFGQAAMLRTMPATLIREAGAALVR